MKLLFWLALLSLVQQMGDPSYGVREKATALFSVAVAGSNSQDPHPVLFLALKHPDAEIAARARKIHNTWAWRTAGELQPTGWPYTPWIDSLPSDYKDRCQIIQFYLWESGHKSSDTSSSPHWPKYRQASKLFIYRMLKIGATTTEVRGLLDRMADYEKTWIKKHQHTYQFPAEMLKAAGIESVSWFSLH